MTDLRNDLQRVAPAPADELPDETERTAPAAPAVSELELERLRREVKSRLFGASKQQGPVSIDRYRIVRCIGQGGMGIVYAARDERLGRTVAIKLLRPELGGAGSGSGSGGQFGASLAKEARSLARLSHPNVVAVFDVGEHDGQVFVAMEYVEGQSLRHWLSTPRALTAILEVFIAAGDGLAAAHRAGLVHRDFKPDNVLVGTDGRPRILDFGLARAPIEHREAAPPTFADNAEATATSLSRHGLVLGTPAYMAPEQHLGERADARSDQFGFCVALYQALYRSLPFPSDDLRTLSLAIVAGRYTPPPVLEGVPERLRRLVMRGLRVDPAARYADMDALLTELRDILLAVQHPGRESGASLESQPEPQPEPQFDTRAIERVFGVAGASAASGRPTLSASELDEIADEVGLELYDRDTSQNPSETSSQAPAPEHTQSGERTHFGLSSTILTERTLSALPNLETQRRIIREIERNLGGTGIVEQFDAGLTWANHEAEASIDRLPSGARLVLRRNFDKLARKRRRKGMALGWLGGAMLGGMLTDLLPHLLVAFEPLLVFGGMGFGIFVGHEVAKRIHAKQMQEERSLMRWVGDRVEALIGAEQSTQGGRALPPADTDSSRKGRL